MASLDGKRFHNLFRFVSFSEITGILILTLFLQLAPATSQQEKDELIKKDISKLAVFFPGTYSNLHQYHKHAQRGLPPNKRNMLIRSEFFRVTPPLFNDSLTIYFRDFTKFSADPFRSGFYSFTFDHKMNVFRMRTYKVKRSFVVKEPTSGVHSLDAELVRSALARSNISADDMLTYKACDMFWKRIGENIFVGITGPQCLGSLGKDQVRIGVSMTLTLDRLLLTEGWYNIRDGSNVSEAKVPYILQKLKTNADDLQDQPDDTQSPAVKPKGRRAIQPKSLERRRESQSERAREEVVDDGSSIRVLRTFHQVAAALVGGYDVTYRVELSACSMPQQIVLDRLSFGGRVKDFLFVRRDGVKNDRTDYVFFVTKKTVIGSQGAQIFTREVTLLRGGRLHIKVTKSYLDPNKIKKEYAFDCRLYDEHKGYGGVKMFINQKEKPNRLPSYRSLVQSLDQGHQLRIVTDLARCQGQKKRQAVIFGNTITDYDAVNGGKTLEVYLPLLHAEISTEKTIDGEGFVGQFLKNGDVALTKVGRPQAVTKSDQWQVSPAYHCKMSSSQNFLENNDENLDSVKVFSTR